MTPVAPPLAIRPCVQKRFQSQFSVVLFAQLRVVLKLLRVELMCEI